MGLVTDDQVEIRQSVGVLCLMQHVDGVIGAEHHGHVLAVVAGGDAFRQGPRVGGGGVAQLVGERLYRVVFLAATLLAHIAIGTHRKTVQGNI